MAKVIDSAHIADGAAFAQSDALRNTHSKSTECGDNNNNNTFEWYKNKQLL